MRRKVKKKYTKCYEDYNKMYVYVSYVLKQ